jgi:hypothetical protein
VRGDRPRDILAAFEALSDLRVNTAAVHRVLDRLETGRFLLSVLVAVGAGENPPRSYFELPADVSSRPRVLTASS